MHEEQTSNEISFTNPSRFEMFVKELEQQNDKESKLRFALNYMEISLASGKIPDFKGFWEARKMCLDLFKEPLSQTVRLECWNKFGDLSKEARRLKDAFDEQSDFAAEQIDKAILALEMELEGINSTIVQSDPLDFPQELYRLSNHVEQYSLWQKELNLLNFLATRITSLRKELIKTDMRIRVKNKFFDRLSKLGDLVFPRRKELIHEISQVFQRDVEEFVHAHFSSKQSKEPFFVLRKDIQVLQGMAKQLTLNPHVFSNTRLKLSACWDETKEKDKERKEEREKKKEIFKSNENQLISQVGELMSQFEANTLNLVEVENGLDKIIESMRSLELGREEVKHVREIIKILKDKIYDKQRAQEEERLKQEEARQQSKRELYNTIKGKIEGFINRAIELNIEEIQEQNTILINEILHLSLNKSEKAELEKLLRPLKEVLREKREEMLLMLPADKRQALEQLNELLRQKKDERMEIEQHIEQFRKRSGSSGLDFTMAMEYNNRLSEEKDRLKKVQFSIRDLEHKIEKLD